MSVRVDSQGVHIKDDSNHIISDFLTNGNSYIHDDLTLNDGSFHLNGEHNTISNVTMRSTDNTHDTGTVSVLTLDSLGTLDIKGGALSIANDGDIHILGNLTIDGDISASNLSGGGGGGGSYEHPDTITLIDVTATNNVTATNVSVSNELDVFSLSSQDITTQHIFVDTGSIGINVETPTKDFEVDGDTRIYGKFVNGNDYLGNSAYGATFDSGSRYYQYRTANERYFTIYNTGILLNTVIQAGSNNGDNNRIGLNPNGGFVGINKDYAGYNLDVAGNINYSGELSNLSDKRIKTNITHIDDNEALGVIRQLQPKKYQYIDTKHNTNDIVYGFIALEVKETIPYAVKLSTDAIPDIMTTYSCSTSSTNDTITIIIHNRLDDVNVGDSILLRVNTTDYDTYSFKAEIVSISESSCVVSLNRSDINIDIVELVEQLTEVFVYGKFVDDLHVLNKNAIFVIATAAILELDRKVSTLTTENDALRSQLSSLEARMNALEG